MITKSAICKICNTLNDPAEWYEIKERMFGLGDSFFYFQCRQCECLQIAEFPLTISNYYPTGYYSFRTFEGLRFKGLRGSWYKVRNKASLFRRGVFQKLLHFITPVTKWDTFQNLGITTRSRILDVGCGNGDMFIYPLREIGFKNVSGCDPFIPETIHYPNGLTVLKQDVFEMTGQWDIIIFNHSFEHVANPFENLKKVFELLSPTGCCILRIPTVPCFAWRHYKTNWVQLDAPRHYFLHSPKSIQRMAENCGLFLEKIIYDSTFFQFTGSEAYLKDISLTVQKEKKHQSFFKRKTDKMKFIKLAKRLNQKNDGDQAAFYLRRKPES
jgi:2-polyprenyl-3-methyl-5-hydroxy-6-metoxy-1,4-benzoquinol methylase